MSLPLKGIRVVEFSHMIMGPTCGLILADLGADVVKIEPPGEGDHTRQIPGSGIGFFASFNRNKRSLALDLKSPRGLALAQRLAERADVVIENFKPGGMDSLGLGYATLKARNPRLIYCSMKGFLAGPYEHRPALDEVVQMFGGLAYMTGPPGRPLRAGASVNDMMGGMFGVIGILAALRQRDETGEGRHITSGLFENNAFLVSPSMAQTAILGRPAEPMPARLAAWAIYDVFDTADDQQIFVGVVTDTQWRAFCDAFALPDLAADATLTTNPQRSAARDRLIPRLRTLFKGYARDELSALCEKTGLPCVPIRRPDELFDDPHLNQPGGMIEVTLADGRTTRLPALPLQFDGERLARRRDVPRAGEHSAEVAREAGLSDAEIESLMAEGALGGDRKA